MVHFPITIKYDLVRTSFGEIIMVDYNHRLKVAKEQAVTTGFATQEMLKDKDF